MGHIMGLYYEIVSWNHIMEMYDGIILRGYIMRLLLRNHLVKRNPGTPGTSLEPPGTPGES